MKHKLCIAGHSKSTFYQTPFNNREFDIWGLNTKYDMYSRFDKWFELHTAAWFNLALPYYHYNRPHYLHFLKDNGGRTVLLEADEELPEATILPVTAEGIPVRGGEGKIAVPLGLVIGLEMA